MNNLMQPLKLQLATSFKIYIINLFLMILGTILVYLIGDNSINNYAYILGFEIIFTFILGVLNYSVVGKTYYSLKHDRRLFNISTAIINILNTLLISVFFFLVIIVSKIDFNITAFFKFFTVFVLTFSIANTYALLVSKYKLINLIIILIVFIFCLLFGHLVRELLLNMTFNLLVQDNISYIILINLILIIAINIFNSFIYNKKI